MMMSWYHSAISAVAFWCVIPVIVPLAFLLGFMILLWAGACWLKSALLIADTICWSIILGSGTFWSLLRIRSLSAKLYPVVGAGAGLARFCCFRCGTVSHRLVGVGTGVVTAVSIDVVLRVGVRVVQGSAFVFASI